eukprot:jgi/Bigna1/72565/fgenesh1_pg.20_\
MCNLRLTTTGPQRPGIGRMDWTFEHLRFRSDFDSGNLEKVEENAGVFRLWVRPDCADLDEVRTNYRTWFHFSVGGGKAGEKIVLKIMNLNDKSKLYSRDMRPYVKHIPFLGYILHAYSQYKFRLLVRLRMQWNMKYSEKFDGQHNNDVNQGHPAQFEQLPITSDTSSMAIRGMTLTMTYTFEYSQNIVYFAFCLPFSYTELQHHLRGLDELFDFKCPTCPVRCVHEDTGEEDGKYPEVPFSLKKIVKKRASTAPKKQDGSSNDIVLNIVRYIQIITGFYFATTDDNNRGRRVDLITLSSTRGMLRSKEPDASIVEVDLCLTFTVISVSHHLKLQVDDARSSCGRVGVAVIVPMINPDGVARGHYRTDTLGQNLNRFYGDKATIACQPSIYAIQKLLYGSHQKPKGLLAFPSEVAGSLTQRGIGTPRHRLGGSTSVMTARMRRGGGGGGGGMMQSIQSRVSPRPSASNRKHRRNLSDPGNRLLRMSSRSRSSGTEVGGAKRFPRICLPPSSSSSSTSSNRSRRREKTVVLPKARRKAGGGPMEMVEKRRRDLPRSFKKWGAFGWRETLGRFSRYELNRLWAYFDLHAHASKQGCFIYGNHFGTERPRRNLVKLFSRLMEINCRKPETPLSVDKLRHHHEHHHDHSMQHSSAILPIFVLLSRVKTTEIALTLRTNIAQALFVRKLKFLVAQYEGRVSTYKMIPQLTHCYTVECNYHTGKKIRKLCPRKSELRQLTTPNITTASPLSLPLEISTAGNVNEDDESKQQSERKQSTDGGGEGSDDEEDDSCNKSAFTQYSQEDFEHMGAAIGQSLLDVSGTCPDSRLKQTRHGKTWYTQQSRAKHSSRRRRPGCPPSGLRLETMEELSPLPLFPLLLLMIMGNPMHNHGKASSFQRMCPVKLIFAEGQMHGVARGFSGGKGSSVVTQKRLFSGSRRLSLRDDCRDLRSFYTRNIGIRKPRVDVHATGDLSGRFIEALLTLILKSRIVKGEVTTEVSTSTTGILRGECEGAVVKGSDWESPGGLTCRQLRLTVGEVLLDVPALLASSSIKLVKNPTGSAEFSFSEKDFGAFLSHPLMRRALLKRGLVLLEFDKDSVRYTPERIILDARWRGLPAPMTLGMSCIGPRKVLIESLNKDLQILQWYTAQPEPNICNATCNDDILFPELEIDLQGVLLGFERFDVVTGGVVESSSSLNIENRYSTCPVVDLKLRVQVNSIPPLNVEF